jgi:hypothetical protein
MKRLTWPILSISTWILVGVTSQLGTRAMALLPPVEDTPEEVLRTEIITTARSPVDGKFLTAAEYAELQLRLQQSPPPQLSPQIRDQIFLLRIRQALLKLFPFLSF